jgi:hypothetical protein
MDHAVAPVDLFAQPAGVGELSDRRDCSWQQSVRGLDGPGVSHDLVSICEQASEDRGAHVAGCAGEKDLHDYPSFR